MTRFSQYQDWALLALRLAIGIIFLYHGYAKWGVWSDPSGSALFKLLSIVEPLGGIALILGVLTEWAALGLAIIMVGAIYTKSQVWGTGFAETAATGWEFDLVLLAGNLVLMTVGAGKIALGRMMGK